MKEIRFSDHGKFKIDILANHGLNISPEFIIDTICNPDKIEILPEPKILGSSVCVMQWTGVIRDVTLI
jgi:hypothetical protein